MKTILITGGTGFIAQALFPILTSGNFHVRTTLRDTAGLWTILFYCFIIAIGIRVNVRKDTL